MTEVKCSVDNCNFWDSNKCTADQIEVSKNIMTGNNNTDMEAGEINNFERNENLQNKRRGLGLHNIWRRNEAKNQRNENENNELKNENDEFRNENLTNEDDNLRNNDFNNNMESAGGIGINYEAMQNVKNRQKQDMEAGSLGEGSASSSQTKCVTFKPQNS